MKHVTAKNILYRYYKSKKVTIKSGATVAVVMSMATQHDYAPATLHVHCR